MRELQGMIEIIKNALDEDIGSGDVTAEAVFDGSEKGVARAVAKSGLVLAGIEVFGKVFETVDENIEVNALRRDGDYVEPGEEIARISGALGRILTAERVALNLIQKMSGIATATNAFVRAVADTDARILDTRKTTPGLRVLEKYAVRTGGGLNHRFGLYGGVLIKENHIAASGGIAETIYKVRKNIPPAFRIEVEVRNLREVQEALDSGADIIMLDNMKLDDMTEAVKLIGKNALVEASGNVTLATVREIAETGVDFISVGYLTHSAPAADISLLVEG
ncbi:MAG: carboxylating nicotinate-nucleotide diphosphorylase [Syntrophales bacterium]|jgi:nicotinate-nucleotide pyrophosphorylase (carboxylating)|nr:carboxylating nicotinate-nucleotide diphosphorylase [Syntrophales bacterium]MDY0043539.1 carboxylating nicotinate-nucleotide diphosphorylase [Syntrophales bacterium]